MLFDSEENLKKLEEIILDLAVKGKLVPQDPTDKPASVLLEKIEEEKARLVAEKKIKKPKKLEPIKEEEIPFEIPESWEWIRLENISEKIGSGSTPTGGKSVYKTEGIKFIRSQNVYNSGLRLDGIAYIPEEINNRKQGSIVKAKDILLNITGGSIGRCALVSDDFDIANINQHVMIIRLIEENLRKYIHYFITSNYIQDKIMDVQVGISREGLSATKLSNFIIPIPPIAEQKRIVDKIDSLKALIEKLRLQVQGREETREALKKSIMTEIEKSSDDSELLKNLELIFQNFDIVVKKKEDIKDIRDLVLSMAVKGKLVKQDPTDEPARVLLEKIEEEKARLVAEKKIKKPKKLEPISEEEIPFDIPESWEWVRLGRLLNQIN